MPVEQLGPHRFRWGQHGKVYPTRAQAEAQGRAAYAAGFREDSPRGRAALHRALSPSRAAESRYVLAIQTIMRRTHASVLEHVGAPATPPRRADAKDSDSRFLRRLLALQGSDVRAAFDTMASSVNSGSAKGTALLGIRTGQVPGLGAVLAQARERNVRLIRGATEDFLSQVRQVLEEHAGLHPGRGAGPARVATLLQAPAAGEEPEQPRDLTEALQARVGVSRSRAQLIARDQTTKTMASLNEHRQRAAGVQSFRWSSSRDERVRPAHRELDGRVFSWDEGLPADVADEVGEDAGVTPGEPVNCRCIAIAVVEELAEPVSAGEDEGAPDYEIAAEE